MSEKSRFLFLTRDRVPDLRVLMVLVTSLLFINLAQAAAGALNDTGITFCSDTNTNTANCATVGASVLARSASAPIADSIAVNPSGIGHMLVVPYFSAQGNLSTGVEVKNTDMVNGKAVKIRFRSARNGDDLFDFQVFLAPNDIWRADVSQNNDLRASLLTFSTPCQKPNLTAWGRLSFSTVRLDPSASLATQAADTREGYVEIINMADIPPGSPLFTAITPVNGAASPCSGAAWSQLDVGFSSPSEAFSAGLAPPSTGLLANWYVWDTAALTMFTGRAVAFQANSSGLGHAVPGLGNIVYWPQTGAALSQSDRFNYSADPLLRAGTYLSAKYDLPDLSTPYVGSMSADVQAAMLSGAIAANSLGNEVLTDSSLRDDWVLTMPTRRYSVAVDYASGLRKYTNLPIGYFTASNTTMVGRKVCVTGLTLTPQRYTGAIVSDPPVAIGGVCGDVSLAIINSGVSSLRSTAAAIQVYPGAGVQWMRVNTGAPAGGVGLPILGNAFVTKTIGTAAFATSWEHRYTR